MFSYYGSKSKIAKLYPKPQYNIIIELFAGAAWYSLEHNFNIGSIVLNEKYDVIYDIWNWLVHDAEKEFILNNCDFYLGEDIRDYNFPKPYQDLVGLCINRGSSSPCNIVQRWSCQVRNRPNWASTPSYRLKKIANRLWEIRGWSIKYGDYRDLPNIEATWFIDPPYQHGGDRYIKNDIDYDELREWSLSREGQVIVCENDKANWMDFNLLVEHQGQRKTSLSVVRLME